jgi:hypothetical protein
MLAFKTKMDLHNKGISSRSSSANIDSHRRGGFGCEYVGRSGGRGSNSRAQHDGHGGFNAQHSPRNNKGGSSDHPTCQVCFKTGHTVDWCCHRYDENYIHDPKQVCRG